MPGVGDPGGKGQCRKERSAQWGGPRRDTGGEPPKAGVLAGELTAHFKQEPAFRLTSEEVWLGSGEQRRFQKERNQASWGPGLGSLSVLFTMRPLSLATCWALSDCHVTAVPGHRGTAGLGVTGGRGQPCGWGTCGVTGDEATRTAGSDHAVPGRRPGFRVRPGWRGAHGASHQGHVTAVPLRPSSCQPRGQDMRGPLGE